MKEYEKSLLGALIVDAQSYHLINGLVTAESFYTTHHQHIYTAIETLIKDDAPVDIITLKGMLQGQVPTNIIIDVAGCNPSSGNIEYYAEKVADYYSRRRAKIALMEAISALEKGDETAEILSGVQQKLDDTLPQSKANSDLWPDIMKTIDRVVSADSKCQYLPTGFTKIDQHASLRPGTLTLIAADPGAGKTSYLLCVARHIAKRDKRVLFFTLEMTREQILENIVAQELRICHQDMINGKLSDGQIKLIKDKTKEFQRLNMGIVEGSGWTVAKLRHKVITEARTKGADLVIIDSLTKVKLPADAGRYNTKLTDVYNYILGELVDVAVDLKIPVVISHHMNKDVGKRGKNNRPTTGSLREAGDMWTHNVILIHREFLHTKDKAVENDAEFIIGKARDGKVGIVKAWFDGPTKTFIETDEHSEQSV